MTEKLRRNIANAEKLLADARGANHLAKLAENLAGVGYWWFDVKTMTRTWSRSTFAIYGLDPADGVPPEGGRGQFDPQDREILTRQVQGLETSQDSEHVFGLTRADGERRYVRMIGALERDDEGRVSHMYGAIIDVTDAKRRELALAESEARYRLLADTVQDLIFRYDAQGVVEYISPSVRRYGYAPEDIIGRPVSEFEAAGTGPQFLETLAGYRAGQPFPDGVRIEALLQDREGASVWMETVESGVYDEAGVFTGVIGIMRDVTERHAMEQELRRRQAEAETAVVAKSEFLANMSHEIRTPLTAVIGYTGLLAKMPGLPDKARTYADRVGRSGDALNAIVNNILDFSKIEAKQVVLKPEIFALREFVDDTIAAVQESATAKGLTLAIEALDPPEKVLADRARLNQVLLNLLANAVKFTHEGAVTLRLRHDLRSQQLHISVIDTGVGIAADQSGRLFQRFSQVEGANTRRFGGAGLGLAISKGIVELMDGEIGFESTEGQGATFWLSVPAPAITEPEAAAEVFRETVVPTRPLRILVVDDVRANRELLGALLDGYQAVITEAADGAQAVDAARREPFDVVLMDIQMPGMDGLAATRAIRETSPLNRDTPVIAVSASVLPGDVEACRQAGMNDHVPKPINPSELLSKIAMWADPGDRPKADFAA